VFVEVFSNGKKEIVINSSEKDVRGYNLRLENLDRMLQKTYGAQ